MNLAIGIYCFTFLMSALGLVTRKRHTISLECDNRGRGIFIFLFAAGLIVLTGARVGFVDTSTYRLMAGRLGTDFSNAFDPAISEIEVGFNLLTVLINKVCYDTQFYVFVLTAMILGVVFYIVYSRAVDKEFSIILFVLLYMYTFINGMRQALVAVLFVAIYNKWKKSYVVMIIICLILSLLHTSAIFLIPLCFCVRGKVFNNKIKILYVVAAFVLFFPGVFNNVLGIFLSERYTEALNVLSYGTGLIRVFVYSVPTGLAILYAYRKGFTKLNDEEASMVNILLLDLFVVICSINSVYIARMEIFFSIFVVLYLPYILRKLFTRESYVIATTACLVAYSVYFVYQTYVFYANGYLREFYLFFIK